MSSKSTWAICETISKQTEKVTVYVDSGASVPTAQDTEMCPQCTGHISTHAANCADSWGLGFFCLFGWLVWFVFVCLFWPTLFSPSLIVAYGME